jgi:hypothetical protein
MHHWIVGAFDEKPCPTFSEAIFNALLELESELDRTAS